MLTNLHPSNNFNLISSLCFLDNKDIQQHETQLQLQKYLKMHTLLLCTIKEAADNAVQDGHSLFLEAWMNLKLQKVKMQI